MRISTDISDITIRRVFETYDEAEEHGCEVFIDTQYLAIVPTLVFRNENPEVRELNKCNAPMLLVVYTKRKFSYFPLFNPLDATEILKSKGVI